MKNTIVLGEGNSRTLKAPATIPETWEEARAQFIAGTFLVDIGALRQQGVLQMGMELVKANLLSDMTATLLNLPGDPTVNDAFLALITASGKRTVLVHLTGPHGDPIQDVTISGLTAISDAMLTTKTNADGYAMGYTTAATVTLTANSPYVDWKKITQAITTVENSYVIAELQYETYADNTTLTLNSSTYNLSGDAIEADFCLIGGGGGGGYEVAAGGGGGYVTNQLNVSLAGVNNFTVSVGSGGAVGTSDSSDTKPGKAGGTSKVTLDNGIVYQAAGGNGGSGSGSGTGNGKGGYASAGGNGSGYIFNDSSLGPAGGGGGGSGRGDSKTPYAGGSPNGGAGAVRHTALGSGTVTSVAAVAGSTPGGGGGGGTSYMAGAKGGAGRVYARFRYAT